MAKTKKINSIVGGIECRTPSEYIKKKKARDEEIYTDIRKKLKPVEYRSNKYDPVEKNYKELTYEEKRSEENEEIAFQRLRTDAHRDYKGTFTWLIFKSRRELAFKRSEPLFFFKYGSLFATKDLPYLLNICWELEVYGQCIFYDQKRYKSSELRKLSENFRIANEHLISSRNIILDKTFSKEAKTSHHTPIQTAMFGRSLNTGLHFAENLSNELEILEYQLDELKRIADADLKFPKPDPNKEIKKLQYFIYLGIEIFNNIPFDHFFPDLDLSLKKNYNNECKNFIIELVSMVDELKHTKPSQIRRAYDLKKNYKMKYLGLYNCDTEEQFFKLLKKINL